MCSPVRGCEIQILKRRLLGLHATEVVAGIDGDIPCVSFVCGLTQDDIAANTDDDTNSQPNSPCGSIVRIRKKPDTCMS